jgi:hypothetical protein
VRKDTALVTDQPASGRFVRNLALSLSGGALLALFGAGAAHAQDASTASAGLGATGTGDATALGNHSGSNTTQGGTISGAQGSVQVITQSGNTNNNGVAVANTGGNTATGNRSNNSATAIQTGEGGAGGAVNDGQAANGSDGIAFATTGNASAVGNQSTTNLNQTTSARGALGGILVLTQDSTVTNSGRAFAGTGGNDATGNSSSNGAGLSSTFNILNGLGANSGKATNDSNGRATIATGSASATGNVSDTSVTQSSNGAAGGDDGGGGLVLIPQTAEITNDGRARATTGGNEATGNDSDNGASIEQQIGITDFVAFFQTAPGVASNAGEASNWSGGTADIRTGDAGAVGNQSSSAIVQSATSDLTEHGGLTLLPQAATIDNTGRARATTGGNSAIGNESANRGAPVGGADVDQNMSPAMFGPFFSFNFFGEGFLNSGVASNSAQASNSSDGSATIVTGRADAAGNRSSSDLSQASTADAGTTNVYPQVATIQNDGRAFAGTGTNEATGNDSTSNAYLTQNSALPFDGFDRGVVSNAGRAASASDGTASISTGAASAIGNDAQTSLSQEIDPLGLVLPVQAAAVVNAGTATALTGGNTATGNSSESDSALEQDTLLLASGLNPAVSPTANILLGVDANQGESANASAGSAIIATGDASATGNESTTGLLQRSTGTVDGIGLIVNTQAAAVLNAGAARATTGGNTATGNDSRNLIPSIGGFNGQFAGIGSNNGLTATTVTAGLATVANSGSTGNSSDGTATVDTGDARATGNQAATQISQDESGTVSGIGVILNTQAAVVANAGLGIANTGGNEARGNISDNLATIDQFAEVGDNSLAAPTLDVTAPVITSSNSASVSNTSDGTAEIRTGAAEATGNASSTDVAQDPGNTVSGLGLVVGTQVGAVANVGVGVANSGLNRATGNASLNSLRGDDAGAELTQNALIGFGNLGGDVSITSFGPMTAANQGEVGNASDGTGRIRTGAARAQGNVSSTSIDQAQEGSVTDLGVVVDTQAAVVLNAGVGVANSGRNLAVGNTSGNLASVAGDDGQDAVIGFAEGGGPLTLTALGPITASNAGQVTNWSDGTGQVGTGNATASGNASSTVIAQHQTSTVADGIDVGTQVAGVANVGLGVANSGRNAAVGNGSGFIDPTTFATGATPNTATSSPIASILSSNPAPTADVIVLGPVTAANDGVASNSSDGTACVCTGDATASGNISTTTLNQELDTSVGAGAVVLTEAGGVLNAGAGIANSGRNAALGNISQNFADADPNATINAGLAAGGVVGPQTAHNGDNATNSSDGTGKVGTGNATATGNESTTTFIQAAAVDSDLAVATIVGGTSNTGVGLANSGRNLGVGNASTNLARLDQAADGAGIVSNSGTASNQSDGAGLVGNPDCLVPGAGAPGVPGGPGTSTLPRTGGPLEAEAALALMLLLAGFGLRRKGAQLA